MPVFWVQAAIAPGDGAYRLRKSSFYLYIYKTPAFESHNRAAVDPGIWNLAALRSIFAPQPVSAAGEGSGSTPAGAAEGATCPETLRQKDRSRR